MSEDAPDSNGVAEQYRPELTKATPADFMRPAMRTRATSNARNSKTNGVGVQPEDTRICVVMVGLPARGKSLIAQKGRSFIAGGSFLCGEHFTDR